MPDVSSIGNGQLGHVNRSTVPPATYENGTLQAASIAGGDRSAQSDRVELSAGALDRVERDAGIRTDLVDAVRRSIADGSYETEDRLNRAIDRLIEDLGP